MLKCLNIFFVLKSSCMHPTPLERSRISIARVHFDILRQCTPLRRRLQAIAHVGQWGYIQLCSKQLVAQEITSAAWPYVYPGIWDLRVPNCPQKETWPYLCNSQVECWQSALQGTDISAGGSCEFAPGNNWTNKKGTRGMAESLESGRIDSEECAALMQENIHYCDWETAILQRRSKAISLNKWRLSVHLFIYWKLILTARAYHFPESFFHGVRWIPSIGLEVLSDWTLSLVTHRLSTIDSQHVRSVNGLKHVSQ